MKCSRCGRTIRAGARFTRDLIAGTFEHADPCEFLPTPGAAPELKLTLKPGPPTAA